MLLSVPKVLRDELTDEGAEALILLINNALDEEKDNIIELAAERFESKLNIGLSNLDKKLSKEISGIQANLIKWMFIFWSGQIVVITAILFAFLKK